MTLQHLQRLVLCMWNNHSCQPVMWTFWNILAMFPFESVGNLYVDTSDTKTHEWCMIFSTNTMNINEHAWFHVWLQTRMHVDFWLPWWFILSQLTHAVRVICRNMPFKLLSQKLGHESWFFSILCFGKTIETAYTFLHKRTHCIYFCLL